LGADVPDDLLILALTHPSAVGEGIVRTLKSNQRLEFLGDTIVGAIVAEHLYRTEPNLPEGDLTQQKAAAVRGESLARAAKRLGLGEWLILGKGEEQSGGRARDTILADAFEAVLGAVFLSCGLDKARDFALRVLESELSSLSEPLDWERRAIKPRSKAKAANFSPHRFCCRMKCEGAAKVAPKKKPKNKPRKWRWTR